MIPFGKKIKSDRDEIIYVGFPGSDITRTLPAGKPSPVIDSFIRGRFYQFNDGTENTYIEKSEGQEVVEPDAPDDSTPGAGVVAGVTDVFRNTFTGVSKYAGFLGQGFTESVGSVGFGLEKLGEDLKKVILVGAFLSIIGATAYFIMRAK